MGPLADDRHVSGLGRLAACGRVSTDPSETDGRSASALDRCYRYASADSDVGRLLVVMSDEGLVDVIRGETQGELLRRAASRYPWGSFTPDDGAHDVWVARVVERFEQPMRGEVVPLPLGRDRMRRAAS